METRLQRLEESQLYSQHDHEAALAALRDLSRRFDAIESRLARLEARVSESSQAQEASPPEENAQDNSSAP